MLTVSFNFFIKVYLEQCHKIWVA